MVRLTQKRGMRGSEGDWKEFLISRDPKFGASMCDPSKRPNDLLIAFLKTFSKEDDLMVTNHSLSITNTMGSLCYLISQLLLFSKLD